MCFRQASMISSQSLSHNSPFKGNYDLFDGQSLNSFDVIRVITSAEKSIVSECSQGGRGLLLIVHWWDTHARASARTHTRECQHMHTCKHTHKRWLLSYLMNVILHFACVFIILFLDRVICFLLIHYLIIGWMFLQIKIIFFTQYLYIVASSSHYLSLSPLSLLAHVSCPSLTSPFNYLFTPNPSFSLVMASISFIQKNAIKPLNR